MSIGNIAITGMQAAMSNMEVISNNISNANTLGYKSAYTTFGDVFPAGGATMQAGLGVMLTGINQNFSSGGIQLSSNPLNMMIGGSGFFVLNDPTSGVASYTRNGQFDLDKNGYLTNGNLRVQGYPATNGVVSAGGSLSDIQVKNQPIPAKSTSAATGNVNLNATNAVITGTFDPTNSATYNWSTSTTMYDSLGNTHTLATYYVKTADNTWTVQALVDNANVGTGALTFTNTGQYSSATGLSTLSFAPGSGAASPQAFSIDLSACTQFASDNKTGQETQNGYQVGNYTGTQVDKNGNITAIYSNNQRQLLGKIAIAEFQAPNGLQSIGNMSWVETTASGSPTLSPDNSDNNIQSGALELSNVDLTSEMINLIGAQNSFQANAQVEQTYNEVMKTVIQL